MTRKTFLMPMALAFALTAGAPALAQQGNAGAATGGPADSVGSTSGSDKRANNPPVIPGQSSPERTGSMPSTTTPSTAERSLPPASMGAATAPMSAHYLASNLIGREVLNPQGETIGEVEDLILSSDRGLDGVVISVGEFLGMGGKTVAVDPRYLSLQGDAVQTSLTRDQLTAASDFAQRPAIMR